MSTVDEKIATMRTSFERFITDMEDVREAVAVEAAEKFQNKEEAANAAAARPPESSISGETTVEDEAEEEPAEEEEEKVEE